MSLNGLLTSDICQVSTHLFKAVHDTKIQTGGLECHIWGTILRLTIKELAPALAELLSLNDSKSLGVHSSDSLYATGTVRIFRSGSIFHAASDVQYE
jgi:hypothetical protein